MKVKCSLHKALSGLLLLLWFALGQAIAAEDFNRGLLWKIEGRGAEPSYLFGTMHSEDPDVVRLPAPVRKALDEAHGVTLEVVLDPAALLAMTAGFMLDDGSTLQSLIGEPLYRRVVGALADYSVPEMVISGMKPWAVAVTLMTPPTRTGEVLDLVIYQTAIAAGKPVDGLETPLEQLAVFDELSESDQVALLKDTLNNLAEIQASLARLKEAYLARDLQRLQEISDAPMRDTDPALMERFTDVLITRRNHRMVERMVALLQKGGQFIAVGALHLPGEQGLLQLLSGRGYRVTRVY